MEEIIVGRWTITRLTPTIGEIISPEYRRRWTWTIDQGIRISGKSDPDTIPEAVKEVIRNYKRDFDHQKQTQDEANRIQWFDLD